MQTYDVLAAKPLAVNRYGIAALYDARGVRA